MVCSVCLILLRKILLEAVAILSFSKYSWPIGLQIVLVGMHGGLGTHGMRCCLILWQNVLAGGSWNLSCVLILKNQIANCFVRLKWCALFFFSWFNTLVTAIGLLSLAKYSCFIGVQIVLSAMRNVHYLFYFIMQILAQCSWFLKLFQICLIS